MTEKTKKNLHQTIAPLLQTRLSRFEGRGAKLDRTTCLEIYSEIFNVFVDVISSTDAKLSNEGMNYVAQQYYDGILINGHQELDPDIFDKRASMDNIPTPELCIIGAMLRGTEFLRPVVKALKSRGKA
jgi:hypothetical protein